MAKSETYQSGYDTLLKRAFILDLFRKSARTLCRALFEKHIPWKDKAQ